VGVYPVSQLYAAPTVDARTRPAGLILGYASVPVDKIREGIQILAAVIRQSRR
jgi:GntR family transcriptional regulator/MocR family aminotransferase